MSSKNRKNFNRHNSYFSHTLVELSENIPDAPVLNVHAESSLFDLAAAKHTFHSRYQSLDICGVDKEDSGRSCTQHACCGLHVKVGDVLYLEKSEQVFDNIFKNVVKVYKVSPFTGLAACHIGYVPIRYFRNTSYDVFHGEYLCCNMDYRTDEYSQNRHKSYSMNGLVRGKIVLGNPNINGKNCLAGESIIVGDVTELIGIIPTIAGNEKKLSEYLENNPATRKSKRRVKNAKASSNEMIPVGVSNYDDISSMSGSIGTMSTRLTENSNKKF